MTQYFHFFPIKLITNCLKISSFVNPKLSFLANKNKFFTKTKLNFHVKNKYIQQDDRKVVFLFVLVAIEHKIVCLFKRRNKLHSIYTCPISHQPLLIISIIFLLINLFEIPLYSHHRERKR